MIKRVPAQASAYESLALLLAEQGKIKEAVAVFQKANPIFQKTEIYDEIWRNINICGGLNDDFEESREISLEKADQYFSQKTNSYTIINLNALDEENKAFLEHSQISLSNLKLIQQENIGLEEIYINIDSEDETQKLSKFTVLDNEFNDHAFRGRRDG